MSLRPTSDLADKDIRVGKSLRVMDLIIETVISVNRNHASPPSVTRYSMHEAHEPLRQQFAHFIHISYKLANNNAIYLASLYLFIPDDDIDRRCQ